MSFTLQTTNYHDKKVRLLFDTRTSSPLYLPLMWVSFQLERKSLSTQMQRMSSLKAWYEFWQEKHGTTFCYAVLSNLGDLEFAISELMSFVPYLESNSGFARVHLALNQNKPKPKAISTNTIK